MKHIFFDGDANQLNILDDRFYKGNSNNYYPSVTTILEAYYKGYGFNEWLKQVGYNADEILRKAGEQGTNVHNMIDLYLKNITITWEHDGVMKYTLEEWQMFCKFIEFFEKQNPKILVNEFIFCDEELRFGGCIDLICKISDKIYLIDYKTSNYIHKSHELQIAAYATAWNRLNPQYIINSTGILWLKSATRGENKKGLKIQGEGWQLKEYDRHYSDAFKLFEHTQAIWEEENSNYKPKNLIYPGSFKLKKDD